MDAPVAQVVVSGGKAAGVALADGRLVPAGAVIGNVNPRLLYLKMLSH